MSRCCGGTVALSQVGGTAGDVRGVVGDVAEALGVELQGALQKGLKSLAVLILAWLAYRFLRALTRRLSRRFERGADDERSQRGETLVHLLNTVGGVAIAVAAILTILNFFMAIGPLLAGVGVARPGRQFEVRRELRRRIKNRFDAEGIEIPFPQRTLHVGDPAWLQAALARRTTETAS